MQCAIDGVKREYAVNPTDEIERIRNMSCMKKERDYPLFVKYTHKIAVTKNGVERPYDDIKKERRSVDKRINNEIVCPMNYLQSHLDKIQGAAKTNTIDTSKLFIKMKGIANNRQMSKIRELVEEYDSFVTKNMIYAEKDNEYLDLIIEKTKDVQEKISKIKISAITMNRLIETCLGFMGRTHIDKKYNEATKHISKTFNLLYHADKEKFLRNFKRIKY